MKTKAKSARKIQLKMKQEIARALAQVELLENMYLKKVKEKVKK